MSKELKFDDAIAIAKGCFNYSGGYTDSVSLDIFDHGIGTVINALEGAKKSGMSDFQSATLHRIGRMAEEGITEEDIADIETH